MKNYHSFEDHNCLKSEIYLLSMMYIASLLFQDDSDVLFLLLLLFILTVDDSRMGSVPHRASPRRVAAES